MNAESATGDGYSKQYSSLSPEHLKLIMDSAISPEVSRERGYRTESTKSHLGKVGFAPSQRIIPTLTIPLFNAWGEHSGFQHRPNEPRTDKKSGRPIKYESLRGSGPLIDVPPKVDQSSKS
jgi:hypothetical protein